MELAQACWFSLFQCVMNRDAFQAKRNSGGVLSRQARIAAIGPVEGAIRPVAAKVQNDGAARLTTTPELACQLASTQSPTLRKRGPVVQRALESECLFKTVDHLATRLARQRR